jgi:hypothetical protein
LSWASDHHICSMIWQGFSHKPSLCFSCRAWTTLNECESVTDYKHALVATLLEVLLSLLDLTIWIALLPMYVDVISWYFYLKISLHILTKRLVYTCYSPSNIP